MDSIVKYYEYLPNHIRNSNSLIFNIHLKNLDLLRTINDISIDYHKYLNDYGNQIEEEIDGIKDDHQYDDKLGEIIGDQIIQIFDLLTLSGKIGDEKNLKKFLKFLKLYTDKFDPREEEDKVVKQKLGEFAGFEGPGIIKVIQFMIEWINGIPEENEEDDRDADYTEVYKIYSSAIITAAESGNENRDEIITTLLEGLEDDGSTLSSLFQSLDQNNQKNIARIITLNIQDPDQRRLYSSKFKNYLMSAEYLRCLPKASERFLSGDLKLCPRGYCTAKSKFKVYPSAYANGYAVQVCKGNQPDFEDQRYPDNSYLDKYLN